MLLPVRRAAAIVFAIILLIVYLAPVLLLSGLVAAFRPRRRRPVRARSAWRNSHLIRANVVDEVRKLKAQPGKNILLDGSSVLAQTLIAHDLVDELVLHVYPLALGGGKRLFPPGKRVNLELIESQALPTGVVYQRLRPAS